MEPHDRYSMAALWKRYQADKVMDIPSPDVSCRRTGSTRDLTQPLS